jgi:hypothetical protein
MTGARTGARASHSSHRARVMPINMPSAHDFAAYVLAEQGEMTTWKLQKLVYYSQAWHLVWDGEPLFTERIEAWAGTRCRARSVTPPHRLEATRRLGRADRGAPPPKDRRYPFNRWSGVAHPSLGIPAIPGFVPLHTISTFACDTAYPSSSPTALRASSRSS